MNNCDFYKTELEEELSELKTEINNYRLELKKLEIVALNNIVKNKELTDKNTKIENQNRELNNKVFKLIIENLTLKLIIKKHE